MDIRRNRRVCTRRKKKVEFSVKVSAKEKMEGISMYHQQWERHLTDVGLCLTQLECSRLANKSIELIHQHRLAVNLDGQVTLFVLLVDRSVLRHFDLFNLNLFCA
eukprot:TRINITY_DN672_c0_g1_i1.p2 TRINITY_DN672_c0_g1~~TRINITY_DN672_c0_g1_i1.p2  ORF type:complete len:105 (+),score=0.47 TRINITY_DN672_c0_g1_i1:394-708(+)